MSNLDELGIDWNSVDEVGEFGVMPIGVYTVALVDSDLGPTKDGQGVKLKAVFEVQEGPYKNRKLFSNFNLVNKSEKAQQIGRGQWKRCYQAAGFIGAPKDSMQLLGRPLLAKVGIEPAVGTFPEKNVIDDFRPVAGKQAVQEAKAAGIVSSEGDDDTIPF